ncbi:MAG TPA: hypothetical protein VFW66_01000 [Gemmatimonadales bacterium]|nr:hypothetical protein [Gemmatimonadales bacterium]
MSQRLAMAGRRLLTGAALGVLAACAGNSLRLPNDQDTGYRQRAATDRQMNACRDEVLHRYGELRSGDVTVEGGQEESNGEGARVGWTTRGGGSGNCLVSADGAILAFNEEQSPYATGGGYGNDNGYENNGTYGDTVSNGGFINPSETGPNSLLTRQGETCRDEVARRLDVPGEDVTIRPGQRQENDATVINWQMGNALGSCLVDGQGELVQFRRNT